MKTWTQLLITCCPLVVFLKHWYSSFRSSLFVLSDILFFFLSLFGMSSPCPKRFFFFFLSPHYSALPLPADTNQRSKFGTPNGNQVSKPEHQNKLSRDRCEQRYLSLFQGCEGSCIVFEMPPESLSFRSARVRRRAVFGTRSSPSVSLLSAFSKMVYSFLLFLRNCAMFVKSSRLVIFWPLNRCESSVTTYHVKALMSPNSSLLHTHALVFFWNGQHCKSCVISKNKSWMSRIKKKRVESSGLVSFGQFLNNNNRNNNNNNKTTHKGQNKRQGFWFSTYFFGNL